MAKITPEGYMRDARKASQMLNEAADAVNSGRWLIDDRLTYGVEAYEDKARTYIKKAIATTQEVLKRLRELDTSEIDYDDLTDLRKEAV